MRTLHARLALAGLMAALAGLPAQAAMGPNEAAMAVQSAIAGGQSAEAIIEMLLEDGRPLEDATGLAVSASAGEPQIDLARAGICASVDILEAEIVGEAALAVAPAGTQQDLIRGIIETYETTACTGLWERQLGPPVYSPTGTATGGGTDPSLPNTVPTRTRAPSSPSS